MFLMALSRKLAASVAVALGSAFAVAAPMSAEAAGPVVITGAQYDSPGSDTGGDSSLNAEWIRITNKGASAKSLSGWTLRDETGYVYRFGAFTLGAGKSVVVHTGKGSNNAGNRYWGRTWYVWNNDGDKATLKNSSGTTVSTRSW